MRKMVGVFILTILLSGCSLAPTYERPPVVTPIAYKEVGKWLRAQPDMATLKRGTWWKIFHDPGLNQLEDRLSVSNQNLKAAFARYSQARAIAAQVRSQLFPTIQGVAQGTRYQTSGNIANKFRYPLYSDELAAFELQYEIDVFGRIRNLTANANFLASATAADVASLDLSLHAALANYYVDLRAHDEAQRVLDELVRAYTKAYQLTLNRFRGGASPIADLDLAQSQLETTKALAADNHLQRAQLEHAIAVLVGDAPANFQLAVNRKKLHPIAINPDLPASLLQRRPDIAAAELRVAAANAYIGVTRAAYFPQFNLASDLGVESALLKNLFRMPSLIWAVGPSAALTLIDGGRINALNAQARAEYDETVANYRQSVLNAYQEVEDNLVAYHQLDKEDQHQTIATRAANKALQQALYRYQGGLITYLEVVIEQNLALQADLSLINIRARHLTASVLLIKALGGGFETDACGGEARSAPTRDIPGHRAKG